jgi:hypothetical protein
MKNKFKISLMAILLVCFVASAGWGVKTWKSMYLENCTIRGTLTNSGVISGASAFVFEGATPDAYETTLSITDPTADRTITWPDSSISAAEFGTLTGILATTDELNRAADVSTRIVTLVETGAITLALHEGKVCLLGEVGGNAKVTLTLPEATGSGAVYRFVVSVVNTSEYCFQTVDAANCSFYGSANLLDADANAQTAYTPAATDDLITLNGTTTGGQLGDFVELIDFDTDKWGVVGQLVCPTGSNVATPFSGA